jgi:Diaminopimelate decarboxylase
MNLMLMIPFAKTINKKVNVGVRINPNIDEKTIDKISTGKKTDKFGISIDNFEDIIDSLKKTNNLNLVGISCHVGSQIHNLDVFEKIFKIMKTTTNKFIEAGFNIENLDLGGGLAVQYLDTDPIIELDKLKKIFDLHFKNVKYKISFEPGRYLVANAGCIITNIVAVKNNGGINYLITDAGMNTIVRPALYNAIHRIDAIDVSSNMQIEYSIAGPICESSDILVKSITLPKQTIGNYLVIHDTGAYGHVMASDYNSRGLPAEILINDSMVATIHQPQSIEEIIQQDKMPSWLRSS